MAKIRKKFKECIVELLEPGMFVSHLFAAICSPVAFAIYFLGYSSWLRPLNVGILLALVVLYTVAVAGWHLQMAVRRKLKPRTEADSSKEQDARTFLLGMCLFLLALTTSVFAGREWRAANARTLCAKCEPVLNELEAFKQTHGTYPEDLNRHTMFGALTNEYEVYLGKRDEDGKINWDPFLVGNKQISLFVDDDQSQTCEHHALRTQRMGADRKIDGARGQACQRLLAMCGARTTKN